VIGFLYPWALAGLAAAAIPILLHFRTQRRPPTVSFPAVRYLRDASRQSERRLRLRHWLLLVVRTLLVIALVLAGAGPTLPLDHVGPHAPTALVLVVDNSLSSGVTAGGSSRWEAIRAAARLILQRAGPGDRLWLLAADGIARSGDAGRLRADLDSLAPSARRVDLGAAVTTAAGLIQDQPLPGGVAVLTDLQATAFGPVSARIPILVAGPTGATVPNRGIAALDPGTQPWGLDGGRISVTLDGDSGATVPVALELGGRPLRPALAAVGSPATIEAGAARPGWYSLVARLDPDELRGDDERRTAIRVAPPAVITWDSADRYLSAALATLVANRRAVRGPGFDVGAIGRSGALVLPPEDAAAVGRIDRELAARGVAWRFGDLRVGAERSDSSRWLMPVQVSRRYTLRSSGSGRTGVLVTVGGEPWLVRSGGVLLLGSRLDPDWTALPLSAGFVPFLDAVVNRLARGDATVIDVPVGVPALLPDFVTGVARDADRWVVEGGTPFTPDRPGLFWLMNGPDTAGALAANPDARESALRPATPSAVVALWPTARVVPLEAAPGAAFGLGGRTDLRGPLLWGAAALALVELVLAGGGALTRIPQP
jgi:hypothetical protein